MMVRMCAGVRVVISDGRSVATLHWSPSRVFQHLTLNMNVRMNIFINAYRYEKCINDNFDNDI